MRIATVSLDQIWENKGENLTLCQTYIEKASKEAMDLIIFPEMTLTGFSTNIDAIKEDEKRSETIASFQKLAKQYKVAIIFGIVISDRTKALNKGIFIDEYGNILNTYSKIHPFSFAGEDQYFNHGTTLNTVDFKNHKIGLTICYDLRFPELYSILAKQCDIIINIANWPKKRIDHWNTLLKARAIENQLYIIGVNRTGIDGNKLEYEESSYIFNANGEKIQYTQKELMKFFNIHKEWTIDFKHQFSTIQDRNEKLYKELLDAY